tara:strand:- start:120 stop:293 length:174 start_codon:yes stop_codon:yes gene_type:complete
MPGIVEEKECYHKYMCLNKYHLNLLIEGEDDYMWNPLGYEMIRFDEWFMEQFESRER